MADSKFDIQSLFNESKQILLAPKEYFSAMPKTGGMSQPVVKALIYGVLAGIISFIISIAGLNVIGGTLGNIAGIATLIVTPIAALIGLFIGGIIVLIVSAICGGSTEFEANIRVTSALLVLLPINSLMTFVTRINLYAGMLVGLLISLFGLWLLYNAVINSLSGKKNISAIVIAILAVLNILWSINQMATIRSVLKPFEDTQKLQEQMKELMKQSLEEAQKENQTENQ